MTIYVLAGVLIFIIGFILGGLTFKNKKNENALYNLLFDFKKSIDEYKNQNEINAKEVKDAVKNAVQLTKILTTNQNLKGQFGEECLEKILKTCYPNENINYIKQYDTTNSEGKKIRPDYLINLPNNKSVIIDCKLNLEKYIEYKENTDESLEISKKSEFIKDLNNTINNLASKDYINALNLEQCGFILMYIPLETVLTLIYTDNDFLSVVKNANEKNIIIVGNSSILTTLRLIKLLWAKDSQEKNMENIIQTAKNIYDIIAMHSQNLYKIKQELNATSKNFDKEYERITNENKLFKYAQNLKEYGINTSYKKDGKKLSLNSIHSDFLN